VKRTSLVVTLTLLLGCVFAFAQDTPVETQTPSDTIAAIVNGEEITIATLNSTSGMSQIFQVLLSELPQAFAQSLFSTPEGTAFLDRYQRDVLDRIIDSRLMIQQAQALEIGVNESELAEKVQAYIDQLMQQNQMTTDEIDAALKQQGSSLKEYKLLLEDSYRQQLLIQGLQESIVADLSVSEEEVEEYYDSHQDDYTNEDGTIKTLADVSEQIRENLLNTAKSNRWNEWFKQVKASSEITILF
jgi:parvulin-like peptidyl-prolyl isomerase